MTATLSKLETVKRNRFVGELSRLLDTNPKFRELSDGMRKLVRSAIKDSPIDGSLKDCATDADLAKRAVARIDRAIGVAKDFIERKKAVDPNYDVDQDTHALGERQETEHAARDNEPTGLRRLKKAFGKHETSIEDQIKNGLLGAGMRVNRSATNPVILDKLKTNGVEPGFIYRNDWSTDDTRTPRRAAPRWARSRRRIRRSPRRARARPCGSRSCSPAAPIPPRWRPRRNCSSRRRRSLSGAGLTPCRTHQTR